MEEENKIRFRSWGKTNNKMKSWKEVLECGFENILINTSYYELMQFTGLKDKNGKEIYEGDIVKTFKGVICFVDFFQASFDLFTKDKWYAVLSDFKDADTTDGMAVEVIGNIYENPELLEESS